MILKWQIFSTNIFIAIKVDREIRPDVDAAYMAVSQLMNGSGGWPLKRCYFAKWQGVFRWHLFSKSSVVKHPVTN